LGFFFVSLSCIISRIHMLFRECRSVCFLSILSAVCDFRLAYSITVILGKNARKNVMFFGKNVIFLEKVSWFLEKSVLFLKKVSCFQDTSRTHDFTVSDTYFEVSYFRTRKNDVSDTCPWRFRVGHRDTGHGGGLGRVLLLSIKVVNKVQLGYTKW